MNEKEPTASAGPPPAVETPAVKQRASRRLLWLALRTAVTVAAFAWLFSIIEIDQLLAAFGRVSIAAGCAAVLLTLVGVVLAAVRWREVLAAYGASRLPPVVRLARLHLVGLFYNTFLPGAVGGDVVRGIATRDIFGAGGATRSITVAFLERASGLAAVLIVATGAFLLHPLPGVGGVVFWGPVGLLATAGAIGSVALGRRAAGLLPGPLKRLAASLPELRSPRPFLLVLLLAITIQVLIAVGGHLIVRSVAPQVELTDSLVVIPLALAAAYFPLTVAGAGAREAAFVVLYGVVGVAEADALAGSLAILLCQLIVAAGGGLLNLVFPLSEQPSSGASVGETPTAEDAVRRDRD
jgi:uncharacterized membrane protein YbhN (UPF0104 family)